MELELPPSFHELNPGAVWRRIVERHVLEWPLCSHLNIGGAWRGRVL